LPPEPRQPPLGALFNFHGNGFEHPVAKHPRTNARRLAFAAMTSSFGGRASLISAKAICSTSSRCSCVASAIFDCMLAFSIVRSAHK
jgi:hypothetical protein